MQIESKLSLKQDLKREHGRGKKSQVGQVPVLNILKVYYSKKVKTHHF
jgi:hypothetical protein